VYALDLVVAQDSDGLASSTLEELNLACERRHGTWRIFHVTYNAYAFGIQHAHIYTRLDLRITHILLSRLVRMNQVNVFLDLSDGVAPTPFLSIPKQDIHRLTHSPHKWLRFVITAICGARGVLSATARGPVADDTRFAIGESFYFILHHGGKTLSLLLCCRLHTSSQRYPTSSITKHSMIESHRL
jgi:hypothetical protein